MTEREFFVTTIDDELPRFERVFDALPADKLNWRPMRKARARLSLRIAWYSRQECIHPF